MIGKLLAEISTNIGVILKMMVQCSVSRGVTVEGGMDKEDEGDASLDDTTGSESAERHLG